jgi:aminoglycoside phosphotransferase (APT) family kinase protein
MGFPPARGERLPWDGLPPALRATIEQRLGAPVARAVTRPGGFSPGLAATLELADGRSVFAKAVGPEPNPDSPELHRREARVAAALPPEIPAPRLLFSVEHEPGWIALVFEHVEGREPELPWRSNELERVLAALAELAEALTPSPLEAPPIGERLAELFRGWRTLAAVGAEGVDAWARERLDELCDLEARWPAAAVGETLLHCDVRADNILLSAERVVLVDWPHACVGAAWIDLMVFLPSVAMQGGPHAWQVWESHPLGRDAPPEDALPVVAALAGFFVERSLQPPPPGLPTLREFQRAQGVEALAWLRRSLDGS